MGKQELNKKLTEWVGIKFTDPTKKYVTLREYADILNDGRPDFTQSLDACFKWLVPKLQDQELFVTLLTSSIQFPDGSFSCLLSLGMHVQIETRAKTSALALCLAIEKLIDSQ